MLAWLLIPGLILCEDDLGLSDGWHDVGHVLNAVAIISIFVTVAIWAVMAVAVSRAA